jgi:hypothetical protein
MTFDFSLKNTGRTPALNINLSIRFHTLVGNADPAVAQRRLADEMRRRPIQEGGWGNTLFPGDRIQQRIAITYTTQDIKDGEDIFAGMHPGHDRNDFLLPISLVGCIDYRFVFGDPQRHHQTGFILDLYRVDPTHPGMVFIIPKRVTDVRETVRDIVWTYSHAGSGITD